MLAGGFIAQAPKDAGLNNNGSSAKTQAETAVLNPSPVINLCLFWTEYLYILVLFAFGTKYGIWYNPHPVAYGLPRLKPVVNFLFRVTRLMSLVAAAHRF